MQISRYKKGKYSDWHSDSKEDRVEEQVRKLVMIIPLNDDFEGGELQFVRYRPHLLMNELEENNWKDRDAPSNRTDIVEHKTGSVIVFPSDMWHRVKPITKGIRYSLVVWFLGPPLI
jgi:PKHD-type hydroxylase